MEVYNKRSNVDGRKPDTSAMTYGEIAVNYNTTNPRLMVKDSNDAIASFLPESYIDGKIGTINTQLTNIGKDIDANTTDIENLETWTNTPISDSEITTLYTPPHNNITYQIISSYAPDGEGENAPKILFTADYPVASDVNLQGRCQVEDALGKSDYIDFNTIMYAGNDSAYVEITVNDIPFNVTYPYYITDVTECKNYPKRDFTYEYSIIPPLITFSVYNYKNRLLWTHTAEQGMTWQEWIDSGKYDITRIEGDRYYQYGIASDFYYGSYISSINAECSDANIIKLNEDNIDIIVRPTDKIIANNTYYFLGELI